MLNGLIVGLQKLSYQNRAIGQPFEIYCWSHVWFVSCVDAGQSRYWDVWEDLTRFDFQESSMAHHPRFKNGKHRSRKNALMMRKKIEPDGGLRRCMLSILSQCCCFCSRPTRYLLVVHQHNDEVGAPMLRSLESLRDLDYTAGRLAYLREIQAIPLF